MCRCLMLLFLLCLLMLLNMSFGLNMLRIYAGWYHINVQTVCDFTVSSLRLNILSCLCFCLSFWFRCVSDCQFRANQSTVNASIFSHPFHSKKLHMNLKLNWSSLSNKQITDIHLHSSIFTQLAILSFWTLFMENRLLSD